MKVKDLMLKNVITILPSMTWREVAETFLKNGVSGGPVVDDQGKVIGIISEKDLFRGLFPSHNEWARTPNAYLNFEAMEQEVKSVVEKTAADVMSRRLITAELDTPILKIAALMLASGIHRIPVVDQEGKLLGMIGRRYLYRAILKEHFNLDGWKED